MFPLKPLRETSQGKSLLLCPLPCAVQSHPRPALASWSKDNLSILGVWWCCIPHEGLQVSSLPRATPPPCLLCLHSPAMSQHCWKLGLCKVSPWLVQGEPWCSPSGSSREMLGVPWVGSMAVPELPVLLAPAARAILGSPCHPPQGTAVRTRWGGRSLEGHNAPNETLRSGNLIPALPVVCSQSYLQSPGEFLCSAVCCSMRIGNWRSPLSSFSPSP